MSASSLFAARRALRDLLTTALDGTATVAYGSRFFRDDPVQVTINGFGPADRDDAMFGAIEERYQLELTASIWSPDDDVEAVEELGETILVAIEDAIDADRRLGGAVTDASLAAADTVGAIPMADRDDGPVGYGTVWDCDLFIQIATIR